MIQSTQPQSTFLPQVGRQQRTASGSDVASTPFAPALNRMINPQTASAYTSAEPRPVRIQRGAQEAAVFAYNRNALDPATASHTSVRSVDVYV